jgi:hypothetical protein
VNWITVPTRSQIAGNGASGTACRP